MWSHVSFIEDNDQKRRKKEEEGEREKKTIREEGSCV